MPNYDTARGRAWNAWRFLHGMDGGPTVDEVLGVHTCGHHWRNYRAAEVLRYFRLPSPDFVAFKTRQMPTYMLSRVRWKRLTQVILDRIPILRPTLHVEIELPRKIHGIMAKPCWRSRKPQCAGLRGVPGIVCAASLRSARIFTVLNFARITTWLL
ncbi:MAG: hypothetical protein ABI379_01830, partial [Rhodanobacter sp.]